jgi:hypothetical protein
MGDEEYVLVRPGRWAGLLVVEVPLLVVVGICLAQGLYTSALLVAAAVAVLGGLVGGTLWWQPSRVVVGDAALVFVAPARRVPVPWSELVAVTTFPRTRGRLGLAWRFSGDREVRTASGNGSLRRMLSDVERRAPHVRVEV